MQTNALGRRMAVGVLMFVVAALPALAEEPATAGTLKLDGERRLSAGEGVKVRAVTGRLAVREVRADSGSRSIELAFVRLRSDAEKPGVPLVYLAGGPGEGATRQAEEPESLRQWLAVLEDRDVILLDQRGTGQSEPDMRYRWDGPLPIRAFADETSHLEHALALARGARQALLERGVDLRGYTTAESADDVDDLRRALGLPRISILGFSYGTHLGLAVLRRHGASVADAVLVGIEGPDQTWKLPLNADAQIGRLARMAAADGRVGPRVPDLVALLERVLAKLDAEPMSVPLDDPKSGKRVEVPVGSWGLRMILLRDLGDASDLPVFPRLLWSIDQGDGSVLSWFVRKRAPGALRANGMGALVDGASGATPGRLALIRDQAERSLFGRAVNFPFPQVNEVWKPLDLGDAYRAPLVSSVRTLLLSGSLDWNCPPQQAEEIRWGFANATHLIVENAGHEQILPHPDVQRAVLRFLRGEDVSGTRAAWPKMKFVPLEGADPQATHPSVQGG